MNISGHCGGCGFGNQSCPIARCSLEHGNPEYCFRCSDYPCERYAHVDEADSFITHMNQKTDLEKMRKIGEEAYNAEQAEKRQILDRLLAEYNDGRRKTLYCLAVNLLPLEALRTLYPWIRSVHVKDACETKEPGTWGTEVPWGEGEVGGAEFVRRLEALGYRGNYVVEREGGDRRAEDIRIAIGALTGK